MNSLPDYVSFKLFPGTPLEHIFSAASDDLLELLRGLFTFNPCTRITAMQVMLAPPDHPVPILDHELTEKCFGKLLCYVTGVILKQPFRKQHHCDLVSTASGGVSTQQALCRVLRFLGLLHL